MADSGLCAALAPREAAASAATLALVVLVGLNLRPFLTSVGPLLDLVRVDTGLGFQAAAVLTTLPFVLMGVLAFFGVGLARRAGEKRALLAALALLAAGCAARAGVGGPVGLIASAGVAGAGVAAIQALMPGVAKRWFPDRVALAMGLYSAALVGGGALGAVVSPWVAALGGWRAGLAVWSLPAVAALVLWLARAPRELPAAAGAVVVPVGRFFRNRRAWQLAAYFGLSNSGYSSLVAWLPSFYRQLGMGVQGSGNLLAWMAAFQATAAFAMPMLVRKRPDRRPALWLAMALQGAGFAGIAMAPSAAPWLWVALVGFGLGGFFSLSLIVSLDHLPGAQGAGALTAFVQGAGFLIAAAGPWLIGLLRDAGGSFVTGWYAHLALVAAMALLTTVFAPASYRRSMAGI